MSLMFLVDIPVLDGFLLYCWISKLPDICCLSFVNVLGSAMIYSVGSI